MAVLKVKKNGKYINEINLDPSRTYIAGRKEGADIFIEAVKAVSREHFSLKSVGDNWQLEVLSKFGDVLYQNEKVRNIILESDCIFFIPPYDFEFFKDGAQSKVSNNNDEGDEFEKTVVGQVEYIPQIQFLNESMLSQKTITLHAQTEWTAGRDQNCEIQIDDQRVSRKQFQILKVKSEYFLFDLGSVNGTILNNKNIVPNEKVKLRSGDKIQVLDNVMVFELKNPNFDRGLMELKEVIPSETNALVPFGTQVPTALSNAQQTQNSLIQYSSEQAPLPSMYQPQDLSVANPNYSQNALSPYMEQNYQLQQEGELPYEEENQDQEDEQKKKKIRIALIGAVVFVLAIVFYNEILAPPAKTNNIKSNDPFAKVNPNELSLLKQSKEIANDYYYKKSYRLALDETQKILKKLEELGIDYKKTKFGLEVEELDKKSSLAIEAEKEIVEYNTKLEEQRKNEEKLLSVVEQCETKLNQTPEMTMSEYDACIVAVIHLNPSHPRIQTAKLRIQQSAEERARKQLEQKVYRENVAKLKSIYNKAVRTEREGSFIQAIEDYKVVVRQTLPDPEELKEESKRKIAAIERMISSKSVGFVQEAEKFAAEKKYKEAILRLKAALKVNPIDITLEQKISHYKRELAKEIKPIWEEATIEETYSQVECTENKSCALEKWKRIIQMDVSDGEYYLKAFTKLKKYGAH